MDKTNIANDKEQLLACEQSAEQPMEESETVVQLAPECFTLVGGGQGILHF
jgi:hypothetical protein